MNLSTASAALLTATASLSGCYIKTEHHITLDHNIKIELTPITMKVDNYHTFENNMTFQEREKIINLFKNKIEVANEKKIQDR